MMKKEIFFVVLAVSFIANNALSMETPQKSKPVKMFHCTRKEIARLILKEGLKSRSQLVREGKTTVSEYLPFPDHDDNIYFQYIDENDLKQIEPGLWDNSEAFNRFVYCVAMEMDPDKTMVYNPDLRFWPPLNNCNSDFVTHDPVYASLDIAEREGIYKKSGMTLREYIEKKKRFDKYDYACPIWYWGIQDTFTAAPICVFYEEMLSHTAYGWNEHTIKKDRIDPSEFAQ
jgi:hypothetical protein